MSTKYLRSASARALSAVILLSGCGCAKSGGDAPTTTAAPKTYQLVDYGHKANGYTVLANFEDCNSLGGVSHQTYGDPTVFGDIVTFSCANEATQTCIVVIFVPNGVMPVGDASVKLKSATCNP